MRFLVLIVGLLVSVFSFAQSKPVVVTSFSVLQDLASQVAPSTVEVVSIVPRGQDAHQYEITAQDLVRLQRGALVISIGASFEPWLPRALKSLKKSAPSLVLADGMTLEKGGHHGVDPHMWLDARLTKELVRKIAAKFTALWPDQSKQIGEREAAYLAKLDALDAEIRLSLGKIPVERRTVVVPHEAFGYFSRAYGIQFLSPQGWSTETEPTAKDLARIIRDLKSKKAQAIFPEHQSDSKNIQQIAREAGVKAGAPLAADSLSDKLPTYIDLMKSNARILSEALK